MSEHFSKNVVVSTIFSRQLRSVEVLPQKHQRKIQRLKKHLFFLHLYRYFVVCLSLSLSLFLSPSLSLSLSLFFFLYLSLSLCLFLSLSLSPHPLSPHIPLSLSICMNDFSQVLGPHFSQTFHSTQFHSKNAFLGRSRFGYLLGFSWLTSDVLLALLQKLVGEFFSFAGKFGGKFGWIFAGIFRPTE